MSKKVSHKIFTGFRFCFRWFRIGVITFAIAVILIVVIVAIFPNTTLKWAAQTWSVAESPPEKVDAIFVLGGGNGFRPQATAELWKQHKNSKIYVFAPKQELGAHDGNESVKILTKNLAIPHDEVILIKTPVTSTYDEAIVGGQICTEHKVTSVVIPTHLFHTRRVRWIFSKHLPNNCELYVTEAPFRHFRAEDWWKNEWGLLQFPNEVAKTVFYWIRY